jgi:hypothetical protein
MLCDTEFTSGVANEILVFPRITCHDKSVRESPAAVLEPLLYVGRAIDCDHHALPGALRKVKKR